MIVITHNKKDIHVIYQLFLKSAYFIIFFYHFFKTTSFIFISYKHEM